MKPNSKIALVTGANKGIGFEICRQLAKREIHVILTSRDACKGKKAVEHLKSEGVDVDYVPLDVSDPKSVKKARDFVVKKYGRIDILINNAGVILDKSFETSFFDTDAETVHKTIDINLLGPFRLCQAFLPLMKKNKSGCVVNISSGAGQLAEMNSGFPAYRMSKTALNALTKILTDELQGTNILVNSMCPGWVRTDMGGPNATRSVEEGADTAIWLATLPKGGPSGGFFRDRKPIAW